MNKISLRNLSFNGEIHNLRRKTIINSQLKNFDFDFHFGKSYILSSKPTKGSWAISWIIGGAVQEQDGTVQLDNKDLSLQQRRHFSWLVRYSEIKRYGFWQQSVKAQIQSSLRTHYNSLTEEELVSMFQLTPFNYDCKLSQMRDEVWSASIAIGFAIQKRVYCFPHLGYLRDDDFDLFRLYGDTWLGEIIARLTDTGALVLIPTHRLDYSCKYVDEIIHL